MDNLWISIKSCEMLEIDIHVCDVLNAMKFLDNDIKCRQISKKNKFSENYVKESKNVYVHKVDLTLRNQERENVVETKISSKYENRPTCLVPKMNKYIYKTWSCHFSSFSFSL